MCFVIVGGRPVEAWNVFRRMSPPFTRYAEKMSSHTTSSSYFSQTPDRANRSVKSIGSRGSILSIGSVNSFCSIGSVNSAFSIGSVFSLGSVGSVFSAGAIASCLGFLGVLSVLSGLSVLSVGSYRSVLKVNRRPGTRRSQCWGRRSRGHHENRHIS